MRDVFKEWRLQCTACDWAGKLFFWASKPASCPTCGAETEPSETPPAQAASVHPDDIPGGMLIHHGICHADGSPRRFDSKSAIRAAAAAKGWTINGETPKDPGSRWV